MEMHAPNDMVNYWRDAYHKSQAELRAALAVVRLASEGNHEAFKKARALLADHSFQEKMTEED